MFSLILSVLLACGTTPETPSPENWPNFSIHEVVESGGTATPQRGSDEPLMLGPAAMDGSCVQSGAVREHGVSITLTEACAPRFAELTKQNIGQKFAIVVNGEILTAPIVRESITSGKLAIDALDQEPAALLKTLRGE